MAHSFHISPSQGHLKWNNALPPDLTVPSGAEVSFDLKDGGNNPVHPYNASTALSTFSFDQTDPAFGPIYVQDAEPGDNLQVEIHDLIPGAYAWTAIETPMQARLRLSVIKKGAAGWMELSLRRRRG